MQVSRRRLLDLMARSPWAVGVMLIAVGLLVDRSRGHGGLESHGGERRCLSLRALQRIVLECRAAGRPLPERALDLAGIGWLEGFVVDERTRDVVLIGSTTDTPLLLDDLIVALGSKVADPPHCSLDPEPANVLAVDRFFEREHDVMRAEELEPLLAELREAMGPQGVVVGGVPVSSRWSHAMVFADYYLKAVHQGVERVPGVASALERSIERARESASRGRAASGESRSRSRLWFHLERGEPTFVEIDGAAYVDRCKVVVLTKRQTSDAQGRLSDSDRQDADTLAFARDFSRALPDIEQGDCKLLVQLYRLLAVVRAIEQRDALAGVQLDLSKLVAGYTLHFDEPLSEGLPALASGEVARIENGRADEATIFTPLVVGGVSMEMRLHADRTYGHAAHFELAQTRTAVLTGRPSVDALSWTVSGTIIDAKAPRATRDS